MGVLDRFRAPRNSSPQLPSTDDPSTTRLKVSAQLFTGEDDLEVVGESHYQSSLWAICGGAPGDRVRHPVIAALVPEPQNAFDPNAISVQIDGFVVGYLARDIALLYRPALLKLMNECDGYVALEGVIVGGGHYDDGPGRLGVWLEHDQADFGLPPTSRARRVGTSDRITAVDGSMRTGFTEAWTTDIQDESYDLSWYNDLPDADRPAIAMLRDLLLEDPDPIDRHFQFAELESRLYRCRDLFESALDEFDSVCQQHDAEMEAICGAFRAKWGKVPLLETYRQMAIRQQKKKDWDACVWWAERGLALYGEAAAREEAVEDLLKRRNRAMAKLESAKKPSATGAQPTRVQALLVEPVSSLQPTAAADEPSIEILVCSACKTEFERVRVRGRKPSLCPPCRSKS